MQTDQHPIPPEALPPGWGPADLRDDHLAYRRNRPFVELIASCVESDRSHPALGLCRCWELRCRHDVGELSDRKTIGRVSTRHAAVRGLLECMNRINERAEKAEDIVRVGSILESVKLENLIPDGTSRNVL